MLINIRISELQSNTSKSIPLAIGIAISFNYPLFQLLPYNITTLNNIENSIYILLYNIKIKILKYSTYNTLHLILKNRLKTRI